MIPSDFNLEEFAKGLTDQAVQAFPPELPDRVKQIVANTIYEFIKLAGNGLTNEQYDYDINATVLICQLVGEWMFHKGIDNFKNEIPEEYWKPILQQIAFAIYETAKNAIAQGKTQNEVVDVTEVAVMEAYKQMMEQLDQQNKLKKSVDEIMHQSNLKDYVEHNVEEEEANNVTNEKEMKYMCIALFIKSLPPEKVANMVKLLSAEAKNKILAYLDNPNLERVVDPVLYQEYLEKFNNSMPKVQLKKRKNNMFSKFNRVYEDVTIEKFEEIINKERKNVKNFLLYTYNGKMYNEGVLSLDLQNTIIDYMVQKDNII